MATIVGQVAYRASLTIYNVLEFVDDGDSKNAGVCVGAPKWKAQPLQIILDETEDHETVRGSLQI